MHKSHGACTLEECENQAFLCHLIALKRSDSMIDACPLVSTTSFFSVSTALEWCFAVRQKVWIFLAEAW